MRVALVALVSAVVLVPVHVLTMAVAGGLLGATPMKISLFFGPQLFARGRLVVRAIPLGGFVKFGEDGDAGLERLSRPRRLVTILSGCAVLIALGLVLGAPLAALPGTLVEAVRGTFSPFAVAAPHWKSWAMLAQTDPPAAFAFAAVTLGALNLLPFGPLNGGAAVNVVFGLRVRARERMNLVGLLTVFPMVVCWLIGLYGAITG